MRSLTGWSNHFPTLKVVFLARDPVERAWSQLPIGVRLGIDSQFAESGCADPVAP
jgi:hypothetical protein